MPKRPKQHQLEDLSRGKFQLILPESWVFRNKDKDYGVDGEVELFDSNGIPQGLMFYVQLKATNSTNPRIILKVTLDLETLEYFKLLDIPVLLVRYSQSDDVHYFKWVNNIDTYYSKKGAKTLTISLEDVNRWNSDTPIQIQNRLAQLKKLKSGHFRLPLSGSLNIIKSPLKKISPIILKTLLNQQLSSRSEYIIFPNNGNAVVQIFIENSRLTINLCDSFGFIFHGLERLESASLSEQISKIILLGLAVSMIHTGQFEYCARIIFENNLEDFFVLHYDVVKVCTPALLNSSYFDKVLILLGRIMDKGDSLEIEVMTRLNLLYGQSHKDQQRVQKIEEFLLARHNSSSFSSAQQEGVSFYNLGSFYRGINKYYEAVHYYNRARKLAPIYLEQNYFYYELGSILFLLKKFQLASKLYSFAISKDAPIKTIALNADALMFSGNYEKALLEFYNYFEKAENPNSIFILKSMFLKSVVYEWQITDQKRATQKANMLSDVSNVKNDEERLQILCEALSIDMLSANTWYNLAILNQKSPNLCTAAQYFLWAAIIDNDDLDAWSGATFCAFSCHEITGILPLIIETAHYYHRDRYITTIYTAIESQKGPEALVEVERIFAGILPKNNVITKAPILRMINESGQFENIIT